MHNFIADFRIIHDICKKAVTLVNDKGNVIRLGVVPTFSDLEVVALSLTAEELNICSENYLFNSQNKESLELLYRRSKKTYTTVPGLQEVQERG